MIEMMMMMVMVMRVMIEMELIHKAYLLNPLHPSIHLSIYPSIFPSIHPSIHVSRYYTILTFSIIYLGGLVMVVLGSIPGHVSPALFFPAIYVIAIGEKR